MNNISLFSDNPRDYLGYALHSEDTFSFLSRSAQPASYKVRDLLNSWFDHYPTEEKIELLSRYRTNFPAAFFESLLHEALILLGHEVKIHPPLDKNKSQRPDFFAQLSTANSLYLEATILTDESDIDKAKNKVLAGLYDQINQLRLPGYILNLKEIINPSSKQPSGNKLKRFISECIKGLNHESLLDHSNNGRIHDLPEWTYRENDITVTFGIIPINLGEDDYRYHHSIGIYPSNFMWGDGDRSLLDKLKKKASKYGNLGSAYIIAINYLGKMEHSIRMPLRVLFGKDQNLSLQSINDNSAENNIFSFWFGPKGPHNTRVSAVLITRVSPWNLPLAKPTLYHNPWAEIPYNGPLNQLSQVTISKDGISETPGISLGSIFSLDSQWPGHLFEDDIP